MSEEIALADGNIREIQRLRGLLAMAEADAAAIYQQIEDVRAKAAPLSADGETAIAYTLPAGTLHVLFGMARGRRDGNKILAERDQLKAALDEVVGRELAREAESGASDGVTRSAVARGKPISAKRAAALLAELDAARRVIAAARQAAAMIDSLEDAWMKTTQEGQALRAALAAYDAARGE